jgi:outer membrane lipoprotein LolB
MRNYLKWILLTAYSFVLMGCASLSHEQPSPAPNPSMTWDNRVGILSNIQNWDLKGLIALRNSRDAYSSNWQWHQNQKNYTIDLIGPLGSNSIQLTGSPNSVVLETSNGKKLTSTSPEALLEQQLGSRVPVSNLYYWVRGLPVPGIPAQKQLDASHRISVLMQQGWRIEYLRYVSINHVDLPSKMILNNSTLNVKIIINQWQF